METGTLQSVRQFTLEKKQRSLQLFSQTVQVCKSQHNDDVGIPQHLVPSRSQTDSSWCRSLHRDEAPGRDLNHAGLRLQRAPAASLQDSARGDGVRSCMRSALLKSLSCQDCIMLERVNGKKSTSSSWRFVRGHPEATFESVVAGNITRKPTERTLLLLLCTWNWRTLAVGKQEHQAMQQEYKEVLINIYYILAQLE